MPQINPLDHSADANYKLVASLVVPRPIAWVSSVGADGVINLAPYSFFNLVGGDPLHVLISISHRDNGALKDTARNILHSREFVVNLVTEELAQAMNLSSCEFPADASELEAAGLHAADSRLIAAPRVAEAAVSLECRLSQTLELGGATLIIGEIVMIHAADGLVDTDLNVAGFHPVARMGAPAWYCRTGDRFEMARPPLPVQGD